MGLILHKNQGDLAKYIKNLPTPEELSEDFMKGLNRAKKDFDVVIDISIMMAKEIKTLKQEKISLVKDQQTRHELIKEIAKLKMKLISEK